MEKIKEQLNYFVYDSNADFYDITEEEARGILQYIKESIKKDKLNEIIEDLKQDCFNDVYEYNDIEKEKADIIYNNINLFILKLLDRIESEG